MSIVASKHPLELVSPFQALMHTRPISPARTNSLLPKAKSYSHTTQPFAPLTKAKSYPNTATAATAAVNSLPKAKSYSTTTQPFQAKISTKTHLANLELLLQNQPSQSVPPQSNHPPPKPTSTVNGGESQNFLLNLSNLFPRRPVEEMSPRSLVNLSRRLSESPRPSPRNPIATRWRQFHGANNWSGLLDPLNEDLRRELVRYGDLVQSSYQAFFHSAPSVSPAHDRPVPLPDRNYRVVRGLFATSSIDMPKWAPGAMTQRSSWIGYVAVCDNENEIRRVGRRDIVIALRGTATCLEWAENLRAGMVSLEENAADPAPDTKARKSLSQLLRMATSKKARPAPKVERGFLSLYKTPGQIVPSLSASVVEEIKRLMEQFKGEELSITVTGHSLGAALALLVADELSTCAPHVPPIAVFSFGGPKVGNRGFADRIEERGVKVLRVVNAHDIVTRVPGLLPQVPEGMDGYAHVGRELRVDSRLSPYFKPNADPACCHDLEAYLHLVDGFLASNCPFRSNAKRSLARLLNQQGSNLKQKYMVQGSILKQKYVSKVGKLELDPVEPVGFNVSGYIASPSS